MGFGVRCTILKIATLVLVLILFICIPRSIPANWIAGTGTIVLSLKLRSDSFDGSRPTYAPCIVYRYEVDGTTYMAEVVDRSGVGHITEYEVDRLLGQYPEGAPISINYSAIDPGWSKVTTTTARAR